MKAFFVVVVTITVIALISCAGAPESESAGVFDNTGGPATDGPSGSAGDSASTQPSPPPAADSGLKNQSPSESKKMSKSVEAMGSSSMEPSPSAQATMDEEMAVGAEVPEPQTQAQNTAAPEPEALYLSADDSNSAASPVIARKLIRDRKYVPPGILRTYEFLNYHTFSYKPDPRNQITIYPAMRKLEEAGMHSLQIALRGPDRPPHNLPAMNFTFLVDASGSMAGVPIQRAKAIIAGVTQNMQQGDTVSLVSFARTPKVIFRNKPITRINVQEIISTHLAQLLPDDITDLDSGLIAAYEVAAAAYNYQALNRVILLSDGGANAGEMGLDVIAKHAEDNDRQGIYLAAIGLGEGFNDSLMNALTDRGRGAYLFVDSDAEVAKITERESFAANFDLALKDVRLKMLMPKGWEMEEFHGEQVSTVASEVIPQYLSPNDQMIYHMTVKYTMDGDAPRDDVFSFEAEYRPIGGKSEKASLDATVSEMSAPNTDMLKGDAVVEFAEALKEIEFPLENHVDANLKTIDDAAAFISEANDVLEDNEIAELISLLKTYRTTVRYGEQSPGARDRDTTDPAAVLGISANAVLNTEYVGDSPDLAIRALPSLLNSLRLKPMEGYKFLALSSGPVANPSPAGGGQMSENVYDDPTPAFMGWHAADSGQQPAFDLHQVVLELEAPMNAKSIAFDFNFFSAEYPDYINQSFNDTFYAILRAKSTNGGQPTSIAFDSDGSSIEVDSNYFQKPYHPIPNTGTGFDYHGSTGWLRTSWPIRGGERFTITFSVHDEGDAIYDSLVLIDNFRFLKHEATGTTDPLN